MKAAWHRLTQFVKQHLTALKVLFVLSVLVFVIIELGRISKDLNGEAVKASLASQGPLSLLLLTVLGILAVTPMLNYDFTITELLPGEYKPWYIAKSGWIVNSFTNIAGFGGFLGASLRANFYHEKATQKQILLAISKIALFLLAGLSLWSLVSLVLIYGFGIGRAFSQYWIWLVGGAAYFPLLMIVSHVRDSAFFADMPFKRELRLTIGSFFEWGFAAGFFLLIGSFLGVKADLAAILPAFMVANVLGVVSMVPGGLGSFDVFMILTLGQIGIDSSLAVVWLLFYRLFYYVIPFIIGAVLFAQDAGKKLNAFLEGLPLQVLRKVAHTVLVVFLYFSGIMLLLRGIAPDLAFRNQVYVQLYPYTFFFLDRVTNILMAFLILGFGRGIASKVKRAYWPTVIMLVVAIIASIKEDSSLRFIIFLAIIVVAVVLTRQELTRDRLDFSWGTRLIDWGIFGTTFLFYAISGFYNAPAIHHKRIPEVFLFPSERIWLTTLVGVLVAAATLYLIYWYLSLPTTNLNDGFDAKRIAAVIDEFGGNEVSHLAYTRDKSIHFYREDDHDQVFFLYRKKADKLIIMGEPVGNPDKIVPAVVDLMTLADKQNLSLVFYEISEQLTMQLHEYGFDFLKFGEEGYVDVQAFTLAGTKRKGERALIHKFEREGYTFSWLEPPFDEATLASLKAVSDSWLEGRPEKGFSLGFFDQFYLNQSPVAVVKNTDGQIVAFANAMPMLKDQITSIDLMRSSDDAPSGIMDEVFVNLFLEAQAAGYQRFDLGMAPLANVGTSKFAFIEERIFHLIYEYGYRFYGFQGLRSYKNKYVTEWLPKYVAYQRRHSLLFIMIQIMTVVNQKVMAKSQLGFFQQRLAKVSLSALNLSSKKEDNNE
ncbi:bifunctional lysylphosphatidylglycerol flippase/synthetase MprF [Lacticaseibacillus saniviri]|uniref:Lysyl-tRNA synthetase n=1 Tax=Lacticaseibacillus saniviri JCM 17471 = DSM 24301 TaxID=1293598 RepID=A0A0R2MX85_9LACO|nr:bifunctional lysylphosphatidylglycerol flippase/synthetase MprF [Lacticaseibacillus saniviri]KRO18020.1 lysyl-tRNA synthetase [Lacticaseibacillus saniviri JCM 17471 = DSM 24301]MCG4283081.1 bifunctional lysylphosphatidylglycerol flippase/synthetase MprF [Lacticaseibacillus saniviri]